MNVSLTPELERFIAEKVETGLYQTSSEVVREALRMFRQHDEGRLEQLRGDIQAGFDDIDRGEFLLLNEKSTKKLASDIQSRGRSRLSGSLAVR
jgi:antitoxin ParD1/3/4